MKITLYEPPNDFNYPVFNPILTTFKASSHERTERFFTFGEFVVSIPNDAYGANKFKKYIFILINNRFWGIILSTENMLDETGDFRIVRGRCLKALTFSRETYPPNFTFEQVGGTAGFDAVSGSTEYCMKHFMNRNFMQNDSPSRMIPGLIIAENKNKGNQDDRYITRFERLSGVLEELGTSAGIGYNIIPNLETGQLVFDCIEGVDRSALQSDNHRIVFEVQRRNVGNVTYTDCDLNLRNVFYASLSGGEFADDVYTACITRDDDLPSGIYRFEQHMDISATHPVPGAELNELRRLAIIRAEGYKTEESFSCQILQKPFRYGVDYHLGDILTVNNREWGISMHARLIEMQITETDESITHNATFGVAPINFIERLRRQIRGG